MERVRVLILEDDNLLRSGLAAGLRQHDVQVIAQSAHAWEAIALCRELRPDAVLVDIDLGAGPSGLDAVAVMRRFHPNLGVVILTSYVDPRLAGSSAHMVPIGASYLVKQDVANTAAVARALVSSSTRGMRQTPVKCEESAVVATTTILTATQIDVLRLVAAGMTNAQIAHTRSVSEKSIEHTVTRIVKRLGFKHDASENVRVRMTRYYFSLIGSNDGRLES